MALAGHDALPAHVGAHEPCTTQPHWPGTSRVANTSAAPSIGVADHAVPSFERNITGGLPDPPSAT
jgi:hypothetical protein